MKKYDFSHINFDDPAIHQSLVRTIAYILSLSDKKGKDETDTKQKSVNTSTEEVQMHS